MTSADAEERFIQLAADTLDSTPEELTVYNRSEISK